MLEVVILCGGQGMRLWPLSRSQYPKQFMELQPGRTLFRDTIERVKALDHARVTVVCSHEHRFLAAEQLQQAGCKARIVLEPEGRNTAPAVSVAALMCREDATLLILPADHALQQTDSFVNAVKAARRVAVNGSLVCFAVKPTAPVTEYGYLRCTNSPCSEYLDVLEFKEKPTQQVAKEYCASGDYMWNSGMFLFQAKAYLAAVKNHAPEIYAACEKAVKKQTCDLDFIRLGEEEFQQSPAQSIDYAVMEKTRNLVAVPLHASWSDLGGWEAVYANTTLDARGNAKVGDVACHNTSNSYVHSSTRLVATLGLDNAVVVEADDVVFVADRSKLQGMRELVNELIEKSRSEVVHYPTVYRPWGSFQSLSVGPGFQVKRITVKPGGILSKQYHHHRAEHWVVVRGTAFVTNGEKEFLLHEDQSTYIPLGHIHRLENKEKKPLEIIEVQTGSYLGEDDIVRLEDVYARHLVEGEASEKHSAEKE